MPRTPQPHRLSLAGTTFQLRPGPNQTQSLEALGPINASLIIMVMVEQGAGGCLAPFGDSKLDFLLMHPPPQVLARTELPALRYRFNAPIIRDALPPYSWHYSPWTKCSAQCAGGEGRGGVRGALVTQPSGGGRAEWASHLLPGSQVQAVECRNQLDSSAVAPHHCSAQSKLPRRQRACNTEPCPPE